MKQQYGLWEVRARFDKGSGTKPCMLLWPTPERDSSGKPTWPGWKEYDLVEINDDRNGGYCNVHYANQYGQNTQTGPHSFAGDLSQWHVYSCELNPTGVVYRLDERVVKELTGPNVVSQHDHRLGIQLDVSKGSRIGPDTEMLVDWVRISKLKAA